MSISHQPKYFKFLQQKTKQTKKRRKKYSFLTVMPLYHFDSVYRLFPQHLFLLLSRAKPCLEAPPLESPPYHPFRHTVLTICRGPGIFYTHHSLLYLLIDMVGFSIRPQIIKDESLFLFLFLF